MGAYHNALREEGSRHDLMWALERAWAENERLRKAARGALKFLGWETDCPGVVHEGGTRPCECRKCTNRRLRAALAGDQSQHTQKEDNHGTT